MRIGYLKGKEMKKEEKKIVDFLNIYSNYPIKECEDEYNRLAQKLNIKRKTLNRWLADAEENMPLSGSNFY